MKKIIIKLGSTLLLCLNILLISSCSSDDEKIESLFEETPRERIDNRIEELQQLLTSSAEGYKVIYFPKNDEFGGFTFYMNFDSSGNVEMTSDVDGNTAITSSKYEISLKSTVELVFSTRNHIHKVSDSAIEGLIGSGYKGNSNFQYISNSEGNILFKDARNDAELTFIPVQSRDEWDNVNESLETREKLIPSIDSSVFQQLIYSNNNQIIRYDLNYSPLTLFAQPLNESSDGTISELEFGIAFTTNGLVVSPAIEIEGNKFEKFDFDESSETFLSTSNGATIAIGFANEPAFISDDVLEIGDRFITFLYRLNLGSNPSTSSAFNTIINQINIDISGFGLAFSEVSLTVNLDGVPGSSNIRILASNASGDLFAFTYALTPSIRDKKLFLEYLGPLNQNGADFQQEMQILIDFWISENGLFYDTSGSFSSTTNSFTNVAGTFTSGEDTSLRVYGLWF